MGSQDDEARWEAKMMKPDARDSGELQLKSLDAAAGDISEMTSQN
jgi:hypothetical protein